MSTGGEPNANRPWPASVREWVRLVLARAGMAATAGLLIAASVWVGHAITGKGSGGFAGGGIAFLVVAVVFQRVVLREDATGTVANTVAFFVVLAMLYYTTRLAEQRIEAASQYSATVTLTAVGH